MIVQENITINNKLFVKTYSNAEFYIKKKGTDEVYVEAIDLPTSNFEYVETEDKIKKPEEVDTERKQLMQCDVLLRQGSRSASSIFNKN